MDRKKTEGSMRVSFDPDETLFVNPDNHKQSRLFRSRGTGSIRNACGWVP